MHIIIMSKYEKDPMKNSREKVVTNLGQNNLPLHGRFS